LVSVVNVT